MYTCQSQSPNSSHPPPVPLESMCSFSRATRERLCSATKTRGSQTINKREKCYHYSDLTSPPPTSPHFSASLCNKTHWKHRLYLVFLMPFSPFSLFFWNFMESLLCTIKLHIFQVYNWHVCMHTCDTISSIEIMNVSNTIPLSGLLLPLVSFYPTPR